MSSLAIKLWAIFAMTLDHIGWAFVSRLTPLGFLLHILGRTTAPIMCFCLVEGYLHTKSVSQYAGRLLAAALITQIPYSLYSAGTVWYPMGNMLFTLLLCILALKIWDSGRPLYLRIVLIFLLCLVAQQCDWGYYAILFCLSFYLFRGSFKRQALAFSAAVCWVLLDTFFMHVQWVSPQQAFLQISIHGGLLLALPFLALYNGQKGPGGRGVQLFFYAYYPLHLLVLYVLKIWLLPGQYFLFG